MQKFKNVRNIYVNNKKYSCCDWWQYDNDKKAWVFSGELFCEGWYKKVRQFTKVVLFKT